MCIFTVNGVMKMHLNGIKENKVLKLFYAFHIHFQHSINCENTCLSKFEYKFVLNFKCFVFKTVLKKHCKIKSTDIIKKLKQPTVAVKSLNS